MQLALLAMLLTASRRLLPSEINVFRDAKSSAPTKEPPASAAITVFEKASSIEFSPVFLRLRNRGDS